MCSRSTRLRTGQKASTPMGCTRTASRQALVKSAPPEPPPPRCRYLPQQPSPPSLDRASAHQACPATPPRSSCPPPPTSPPAPSELPLPARCRRSLRPPAYRQQATATSASSGLSMTGERPRPKAALNRTPTSARPRPEPGPEPPPTRHRSSRPRRPCCHSAAWARPFSGRQCPAEQQGCLPQRPEPLLVPPCRPPVLQPKCYLDIIRSWQRPRRR